DLCLGCFGESADLNGNLLFELAVGKNLHTVAVGLHDASLNERCFVDNCAVFKSVEGVEIDRNDLLREDIVETSLRDSSLQRHLAAFEAGTEAVTRSCLLALVALAGRLAVAGAVASADALCLAHCARRRSEFVKLHVHTPP